jgi:hypothetical protein
MAQINPFFKEEGRGGGAEQPSDYLDWAVQGVNVCSRTEYLDGPEGTEAHITLVFTPQTFRKVLKDGLKAL